MKRDKIREIYGQTGYREYNDIHYDPAEVGRRIRSLREDRGISQMELANIIGIGMQTLSFIELGKWDAKTEVIFRICEYFGADVDMLISGRTCDGFIDGDLARTVRGLDHRQQAAFRNLLDVFMPEEK